MWWCDCFFLVAGIGAARQDSEDTNAGEASCLHIDVTQLNTPRFHNIGRKCSHAALATPAAVVSYGYSSTVTRPLYFTSPSAAKIRGKSMAPLPGVRC